MAVWNADTATQLDAEAHDTLKRYSGLATGTGSFTHVLPAFVEVRI
jgi:hypothetical protein